MNLVQSLLPQRPQIIRPSNCRRTSSGAGKLAPSVRRELSRDEAVDLLLTKPYDIDQKLLEYEHDLIKQALAQADGKVSHAAKLVGKSYQGLAKMIETKHPDLIEKRTPVRRRTRKARDL